MIRNVVVGTVRSGVEPARVEEALAAIEALEVEGVALRTVTGLDLGLREGNATYAITVDLDDEDAYRAYDADERHNRVRAELFAPISEEIRRIQIRLP